MESLSLHLGCFAKTQGEAGLSKGLPKNDIPTCWRSGNRCSRRRDRAVKVAATGRDVRNNILSCWQDPEQDCDGATMAISAMGLQRQPNTRIQILKFSVPLHGLTKLSGRRHLLQNVAPLWKKGHTADHWAVDVATVILRAFCMPPIDAKISALALAAA